MTASPSLSLSDSQVEDGEAFPQSPSKRRKTASSAIHHQQREIGLMRNDLGPKSTSFIGSASGIHFIRSVYGAIAESGETQTATPEGDTVPGEDDRLQQQPADVTAQSLWLDTEIERSRDQQESEVLAFDDLLQWSSTYFDIWHPLFPFLHAPSILDLFQEVSQGAVLAVPDMDWANLSIIRAVMSISLADKRQLSHSNSGSVPACLVFESFDAAIQSVQAALNCPATVRSLQALLCVQLFLVSMLRHNAASRLGGLIVSMAFQLGLHRCPARFRSFSAEEAQMRQRLFWSIYSIERYLCQSLGLPLTIHDDDVDVCYPDQEKHSHRPDNNPESDDRLRLLSYLAKHAEIRGLIMELRNKSIMHSKEDSEAATVVNTKIIKWWNDIEDFLDDQDGHEAPFRPLHLMILTVLRHESVIALNRPLLASSKRAPTYGAALQACIESSKAILNALNKFTLKEISENRTSESTGGVMSLPLLWPSFTWAVWMSSFIMVYAAAESQIAARIAMRSTERALEILRQLSLRGSVWPSACAIAIQNLRKAFSRRHGAVLTNKHNSTQDQSTHRHSREKLDQSSTREQLHWPTSQQEPTISTSNQSSRAAAIDVQPSSSSSIMPPFNRLQTFPDASTTATPSNSNSNSNSNTTTARVHSSSQQQNQLFNTTPAPAKPNDETVTTPAGHLESISMPNFLFDGSGLQETANDYSSIIDGFATEGNTNDPFYGFDIPFWMNQDSYAGLPGVWGD